MCLGHTGLQATEGKQIALITGLGRSKRRERNPQSLVLWKFESRRHDTDDRVRLTVDLDAAPEDTGIGSIPDRPEVVAQDDDAGGVRLIVRGGKAATDEWRNAKKRKEVPGNGSAEMTLRFGHARQRL